MNKPKALKDKTPAEFVAHIESVLETTMRLSQTTEEEAKLTRAIIRVMKEELERPAPNPFTPDQLATMREWQRNGYQYAAMDSDGSVYLHKDMPEKGTGRWHNYAGYVVAKYAFLETVISWIDTEPLCFADYAPLQGADHV